MLGTKALSKYPWWFVLVFAAVVYLALTLPILFVSHHFASNLEPYPDGLLFALSARNLAQGHGLQLVYQSTALPLWVPPLYALILAPVYLMTANPLAFVLTNIGLGLLTMSLVGLSVWQLTKKPLAVAVSLMVLATHLYLVWLVSVPMSENIALVWFSLALYILLKTKITLRHFCWLAFSVMALVLTRYASITTAAAIAVLSVVKLKQQGDPMLTKVAIGLGMAGAVVAGLVLLLTGNNPLSLLSGVTGQLLTDSAEARFYSLSFIPSSTAFYLKALIGLPTRFLWLTTPLTTLPVLLLSLVGGYYAFRTKKNRWPYLVLLVLLGSPLVLLSIFYSQDARYIVGSLPLLAVGAGLSYAYLSQNARPVITGIILAIVLIVQIWSQLPLARQVIASNWMGRSVAWQYEAIKHSNQTLPNDSYYITALPPYLVGAYGGNNYHTLPVSAEQEFAQKDIQSWGTELNFADLPATYDKLLLEGKKLYISNAYISHLSQVVADFDRLTQRYALKKISDGCLGTCNIYELGLRQE